MNKKIFIMPLAICAMSLASCNSNSLKGINRHTFKDSDSTTVSAILEGLASKQWDGEIGTSKVKMQDKKGTINVYNEANLTRKYSKNTEKYGLIQNIQGGWDQDNKIAKFNVSYQDNNFEVYDDFPFYRTLTIENESGYKIDGKNITKFINNKMTGLKAKSDEELPKEVDFNTFFLQNLFEKDDDESRSLFDFWVSLDDSDDFDGEDTRWVCVDLFGGYNEHSLKEMFNYNVLKAFGDAGATVKFGSNDDKSAMISVKGTLTLEQYEKCWRPAKSEITLSGNVDVDFFVAIENCFVNQFESKVTYKDCKYGDLYTTNGEVYSKIDVNYGNGSTIAVNLDDYEVVEIE